MPWLGNHGGFDRIRVQGKTLGLGGDPHSGFLTPGCPSGVGRGFPSAPAVDFSPHPGAVVLPLQNLPTPPLPQKIKSGKAKNEMEIYKSIETNVKTF